MQEEFWFSRAGCLGISGLTGVGRGLQVHSFPVGVKQMQKFVIQKYGHDVIRSSLSLQYTHSHPITPLFRPCSLLLLCCTSPAPIPLSRHPVPSPSLSYLDQQVAPDPLELAGWLYRRQPPWKRCYDNGQSRWDWAIVGLWMVLLTNVCGQGTVL